MSRRLTDEDGIDGPHEAAWRRAMREDQERRVALERRRRRTAETEPPPVTVDLGGEG